MDLRRQRVPLDGAGSRSAAQLGVAEVEAGGWELAQVTKFMVTTDDSMTLGEGDITQG